MTHTSHGRTPLDKRSAHRRDLYLTTPNIHKTQTTMPLSPERIRTRNPSKRATPNPRLAPARPLGPQYRNLRVKSKVVPRNVLRILSRGFLGSKDFLEDAVPLGCYTFQLVNSYKRFVES